MLSGKSLIKNVCVTRSCYGTTPPHRPLFFCFFKSPVCFQEMITLPAIVLLPEDSQETWREARLSSSALSGCSASAANLPTQTQAAECELGWPARLPAPHTSLHNCHKPAYSNEEDVRCCSITDKSGQQYALAAYKLASSTTEHVHFSHK